MSPKTHRFAFAAYGAEAQQKNAAAKPKPKAASKPKANGNTVSRFAHLHGLVKQAPAEAAPTVAPVETPDTKQARAKAAFIIKAAGRGVR